MKTKYENQQKVFITSANKFIIQDDLIELANAIIIGKTILAENGCLELLNKVNEKTIRHSI